MSLSNLWSLCVSAHGELDYVSSSRSEDRWPDVFLGTHSRHRKGVVFTTRPVFGSPNSRRFEFVLNEDISFPSSKALSRGGPAMSLTRNEKRVLFAGAVFAAFTAMTSAPQP